MDSQAGSRGGCKTRRMMMGLDGENLADLPECASTVRLSTFGPPAAVPPRSGSDADCGEAIRVVVMVRTSSALMVRNRSPCSIRFESGTSTRTTSPIGSRRVKAVRGKRTLHRIGSDAVTVAARTGTRAVGDTVRTRWTGTERERGCGHAAASSPPSSTSRAGVSVKKGKRVAVRE